ncbi:glycosyltransferase family 1 protein [Polaromonas sp.]|uniref:glycosyltransferase family 4 protein n=1 Tax=Polaromonas sp. TaxID=1869339 RepID=UPI0017BCCB97|nr:glycosyltransferase family 1 protein [Polaromonas sp.]NMM04861.1 glycosyltransferase family 4 protein [Polaromonas sp.]
MRQLLIDVSVIHQSDARTGIQRVVRALLLQLIAAPPRGFRVCPVFATRHQGYCHAAPRFMAQPDEPQQGLGAPVKAQNGDLFLALDLAAHLLPRHQAQVLGWKKSGVSVHVVVYDLLPLQHPQWFNKTTTRNFKRWIKWVAVYADNAICVSESVKDELTAWLSAKFDLPGTALPASKMVLGADIEASAPSGGLPPDAGFLLARLRNTPAVLMVGTLEPRKGHDQTLAAFEHLWKLPTPPVPVPLLVIVGRPGWKTEALQERLRRHPQAGKRLFWFDNISDEFLLRLYTTCRGVLVASRAEGFGLPLVEAALHGKPVLVRDIPVFREIEVAGVTYFNGETPQGLATAINQWLPRAGAALPGWARAKLPTWQLAAAQLTHALGLPQGTAAAASTVKRSNRSARAARGAAV